MSHSILGLTETSYCLNSHPKFFYNILISTSAYRPKVSSRLFHEAGYFKDSSAYIGSLSVTFFCVLQNVCSLFYEVGTPKDGLVFRQIQQSTSLWVLHVQFIQHNILQSRQESLFNVHCPPQVDWCCQEQVCLMS